MTLCKDEYNAIDKFLMESHCIDIWSIFQDKDLNDYIWNEEESMLMGLREGLLEIVEYISYPLSHYGITDEEAKAFKNLLSSLDIEWEE